MVSDETTSKTYLRNVLHKSESFEVVAIQWGQGDLSEMHNHGWSSCAILIEAGSFKNTLQLGGKTETRHLQVGDVLETPLGAQHELECVSDAGKTLHVYTPKIIEHTESRAFRPNEKNLPRLRDDLRLNEAVHFEKLKKILVAVRSESVSTLSPYFMNQLFSGVMPQMLMAEELISQTRTTLATYEASPVFTLIEAEVVEKLGERIGWPTGRRDGASVPGGSSANAMALHLARHKLIPTFKTEGSRGEKFRIFVSEAAHYSFKKSCVFLGLGSECVISIATDRNGRIQTNRLEAEILKAKSDGFIPLLIGATLGTTVLGAFDSLTELSAISRRHGIWLHADAAWGGPALFSKKLRSEVEGVELADSVTFDAHKLFGAGLTCSFLLTQHKGLLLEANDVSGADYLFHSNDEKSESSDRGKMSWQCGRRADAVGFWTIWKSFGTEGLGAFVDRLLIVRDQTLNWIEAQPRLELVSKPAFLNLCVRVAPPAEASKDERDNWSVVVREKLISNHSAMVNYSIDTEGPFLRLILAHPDLQFEHVKNILTNALEVRPDKLGQS